MKPPKFAMAIKLKTMIKHQKDLMLFFFLFEIFFLLKTLLAQFTLFLQVPSVANENSLKMTRAHP